MSAIINIAIAILVFILTRWILPRWMPDDMNIAYDATTRLWGSFFMLWITAQGAFLPTDKLKEHAEWIGSRKPAVARAACIIGMLVAIGFIVMSIRRLLHKF